MIIGVLALQGSYKAHEKKISNLGYKTLLVKDKKTLNKVNGLILPGGESTTMLYLLNKYNFIHDLKKKLLSIPIFATCAGLILLQKLNILKIDITRNAYGPQIKSNIFDIKFYQKNKISNIECIFIRAPVVTYIHDVKINILMSYNKMPILIQKNKILAATFHPELSIKNNIIYKYFLKLI